MGVRNRFCAITEKVPLLFLAASKIASHYSREEAIGFSKITCLSSFKKSMAISAWVYGGVQILTRSTSSLPKRALCESWISASKEKSLAFASAFSG